MNTQTWSAAYLLVTRSRPSGSWDEAAALVPAHRLWRVEVSPDRDALELTLVFQECSSERVGRVASSEAHGLADLMRKKGYGVSGGMGSGVNSPAELSTSVRQARLASVYALVRGPGLVAFKKEREREGLASSDLVGFAERFVGAVTTGGDWEALVGEYFATLVRTEASSLRLQQEIQTVFSRLAALLPCCDDTEPYYHIVDFVGGPDDLRGRLETLCAQAARSVSGRGAPLAERKAREFRDLIARRYMEWDLDAAAVGRSLNLSSSYLGRILKRELGKTFVEYLTDHRMTKARELLLGSDLLTYEIAESTGYLYTHYFSSIFKKWTGLTPSEFRLQGRVPQLGKVS